MYPFNSFGFHICLLGSVVRCVHIILLYDIFIIMNALIYNYISLLKVYFFQIFIMSYYYSYLDGISFSILLLSTNFCLNLKCVLCRQHTAGCCSLKKKKIYLTISAFSLTFTFIIIIHILGFTSGFFPLHFNTFHRFFVFSFFLKTFFCIKDIFYLNVFLLYHLNFSTDSLLHFKSNFSFHKALQDASLFIIV